MSIKIEESWNKALAPEFEKPYFQSLITFVKKEVVEHTIYPPGKLIFSAFDHCPFDATKVVIIGQDPYHGSGQANGLCFSVSDGMPNPPSLKNIFKEIKEDLGKDIPSTGDLARWAAQGALMVNATLTVRANEAGSHQKKGWEEFTDAAIQQLSDKKQNLVFLLWGAYAQKKGATIDETKHLVLKAAHPSPFSAYNGFFGCAHFSKANEYLKLHGKPTINW